MLTRRFFSSIARRWAWWCALLALLSALQPFLSVHFDEDGLVERQELGIRAFGQAAQFEPDEDAVTPSAVEVRLFVPSTASIDVPLAFLSGIAAFLSLIVLMTALRVPLAGLPASRHCVLLAKVPNTGGAPPPTLPWRNRPPETAPPR